MLTLEGMEGTEEHKMDVGDSSAQQLQLEYQVYINMDKMSYTYSE